MNLGKIINKCKGDSKDERGLKFTTNILQKLALITERKNTKLQKKKMIRKKKSLKVPEYLQQMERNYLKFPVVMIW